MGEEMEVGCARPTGGPVGESTEVESNNSETNAIRAKEVTAMIQVGRKRRPPDGSPAKLR